MRAGFSLAFFVVFAFVHPVSAETVDFFSVEPDRLETSDEGESHRLSYSRDTDLREDALRSLDILSIGRTGYVSGDVDLGDAVAEPVDGMEFYLYASSSVSALPPGGAICAIQVVRGDDFCTGDWTLTFKRPVRDLSLGAFLVEDRDSARIEVWNDDMYLGTENVTGSGKIDLSGYGSVSRLSINDGSAAVRGAAGIAYGDVSYRYDIPSEVAVVPLPDIPSEVAVVPLPPSAVLVWGSIAAFGTLGGIARRRRITP